MQQNLKNIIIVGGGSAGWMTAVMLSKQLNGACSITLVESEQIGTIGVGEATIPPIKQFNSLLGIDENEFLAKCNGSIKLGIEFENWTHIGHKYMHPFGRFGLDFDYMPFPYFWLKAKLAGDKRQLQDFSLAWHMAQKNKFQPSPTTDATTNQQFDYAYHFDAGLYAKFLRNLAEANGVKRVEGKVSNIVLNSDSGFIESIVLDQQGKIDGDLFIDCTGQRALLLADALDVGFENWSEYLINDSAVAIQTAHMATVSPYTRSIAHDSGWQWRIPLQTRMGNGNVYCSQYMSKQQALDKLLQDVDGPTLNEPNHIAYQTGHRRVFWEKNCVAIGLSAGFLEPLESTSLHLIQSAIMRLVRLFPDANCSSALRDEYNRSTRKEYEAIRDFIILHYKATERDDSEFWRYCKDMTIPDSLAQRVELYKEHGHLVIHDKELFKQDNWMAVLVGQSWFPNEVAPIMAGKTNIDVTKTLNHLESTLRTSSSNLLGHEMYLAQNCQFRPD